MAFSVKVSSFYRAQGQTERGCTQGGAEKELKFQAKPCFTNSEPSSSSTTCLCARPPNFIILINNIIHFQNSETLRTVKTQCSKGTLSLSRVFEEIFGRNRLRICSGSIPVFENGYLMGLLITSWKNNCTALK